MTSEPSVQRQAEAAEEFDRHENRQDGARVVHGLVDGFAVLTDLAFQRVHHDVESAVGMDSMLMPVSPVKSEQLARIELELFQISEAASIVKKREYVGNNDWFAKWLTRLRLDDQGETDHCQGRLSSYASQSADERRLRFGDILADVFPESRRAPLILFRLLPRAAQIVVALAFGDHTTASELRDRQSFYLPAIEDCQDCRGILLDNGEKCRSCGNPLWNYEWLTSAD